ncbi:MAG: BREX-1 system adenine-specific DNA-methyltransferase PglX, partial [Rhodobacterales bacterium]
MDTNALKKFAQSARNLLIDQVTAKLALVLDPASPARREHPDAMKKLDATIATKGKQQVIEQVAYTWFNRFTALRFMDVNGYTNPRVVSPADGATRPEILADALAGNLPDGAPPSIAALLEGRTPSNDPQAEAYRLLLVHACNQWHGPMPFLFEQIDDYSELLMPEDLLSPTSILARLRDAMADDACADVEIIGWLYQFYISEKKDQVFAGLKKNVKITAENIPAATQLFTPHWIVRYLVENSLGRLWLLNRPQSKLAARMDYYIAPEEPETDFLRITRPEDIRICDPACGSGHMLTYAFDLLHAIYAEEGYEADRIPALILTHNLHGVEIDDRAGALAAFALVMKAAARLGRRKILRLGVQPNICVMQDVRFTPDDVRDVAAVVGRDLFTDALRETLGQFEAAKNFGSLIVPKLRDPAEVARVVRLKDFGGDLLLRDVQERVLKLLEMAEALSPKYHVVVANPPYLGKGMNESLAAFVKSSFPDSKADLFAVFIERGLQLSKKTGLIGIICMQSWMFLSVFQKLRTKILDRNTILSMAHLGERGFDTIGGSVVSTTAFILLNKAKPEYKGNFLRLTDGKSEAEKAFLVRAVIEGEAQDVLHHASTQQFDQIPGSPIAYWLSDIGVRAFSSFGRIGDISKPHHGMSTNDNNRFVRKWAEVSADKMGIGYQSIADAMSGGEKWFPYNKGGEFRRWYGNNDNVVNWENDGAEMKHWVVNNPQDPKTTHWSRRIVSSELFFKKGITWSFISSGSLGVRFSDEGFLFDVGGSCIFPPDDKIAPMLACLAARTTTEFLGAVNPTLNFQAGNIASVPIPLDDKPYTRLTQLV